ncbi:MAG: hypothetical protein U1F17_15800 [Burkholderiaceae bacterium]
MSSPTTAVSLLSQDFRSLGDLPDQRAGVVAHRLECHEHVVEHGVAQRAERLPLRAVLPVEPRTRSVGGRRHRGPQSFVGHTPFGIDSIELGLRGSQCRACGLEVSFIAAIALMLRERFAPLPGTPRVGTCAVASSSCGARTDSIRSSLLGRRSIRSSTGIRDSIGGVPDCAASAAQLGTMGAHASAYAS